MRGEGVSGSKSREEFFVKAREYKNQSSMYSFCCAGKITEAANILL